MVGMYLVSLLVFYYCGEEVVLKVFEYRCDPSTIPFVRPPALSFIPPVPL
jgi:hypothetical protein